MAIAITEGCMDEVGNSTVCKHGLTQNNALVRDEIVSTRNSDPPIPFHKHCQKTVCSAYGGYNGRGATWDTLYHGGEDDLKNIQSYVPSDRKWYNYFMANKDNITQDLRSILELINLIAGKVATQTQWTLVFKDRENKEIGRKIITPWSGGSQVFTFENIGRFLTLDIDGQPLKFHTIHEFDSDSGYDTEELSVELPKNSLTIQLNDTKVGEVGGIYMPEDATINIIHDHNRIQSTHNYQYNNEVKFDSESRKLTIKPNKKWHIYRVGLSSNDDIDLENDNIDLEIDLDNYLNSNNVSWDRGNQIIEIEVHISNWNTSNNLNINNIKIETGDSEIDLDIESLTDQTYVEPRHTNVWVFRVDSYQKTCTYSLAYTYKPRTCSQDITGANN